MEHTIWRRDPFRHANHPHNTFRAYLFTSIDPTKTVLSEAHFNDGDHHVRPLGTFNPSTDVLNTAEKLVYSLTVIPAVDVQRITQLVYQNNFR